MYNVQHDNSPQAKAFQSQKNAEVVTRVLFFCASFEK